MKYLFIIYFSIFTSLLFAEKQKDTTQKKVVYIFDIKEEIAPPVWRTTQRSFAEAEKLKADYILIHLNTYGGLLDAADSIRTKIINSKIPVYVFIDNNAASAGALISIACDSIYMRRGGSIGAATVVDQEGKVVPDKYQSYMRSLMRSTAESHGKVITINGLDTLKRWFRDPKIAEAMVDPRTKIEGINDSGKVLTFTTSEAIKHHFCEGEAESIEEVIKLAGINNYVIKEFNPTPLDSVIGFLINPFVHGILIMLIVAGIYFELQSPGIGFPLVVAVTAAVLYFAPLYLEGLAQNWEILLFLVGLILIGIELFVIPGFGITGISGIVLIVTGLTMAMIDNSVFDTGGSDFVAPMFKSLSIVVISIVLSFSVSLYLGSKMFTSKTFSFMVLHSQMKSETGFVSNSQNEMVGKTGIAATMLRPAGKVEIENEEYDAKSEIGFIDKGTPIEVIRHESGQLYVKKNII